MISVVIQAGGRSSRMGRDKGLVSLAGKPMVEHVISRVQGLGDELIITTNAPEKYAYLDLPMAGDAVPGAGALPGLRTALQAAKGGLVVVVAVDMPFLKRELLQYQLDVADSADVVVPIWENRHQPMHAIYRREVVLAAVERALQDNRRRMIGFYEWVRVREVSAETVAQFDPTGLTFFNINTPADLAQATQIIQETNR